MVLMTVGHFLHAQTCCSGGVPLAGNIGMPAQPKGTFQLNAAYDVNILKTLKDSETRLDDNSRRRLIQTVFAELGYAISSSFSASLFIPYIWQERKITRLGTENVVRTSGIGDISLYLSYKLDVPLKQFIVDVGLGVKTPTGPSDLIREDGIPLNADLQPGSGAWDGIARGAITYSFLNRPSASLSLIGLYNYRGKNNTYLGQQSYKFGNEWQLWGSYNDQFVLGKTLMSELFSLRFRKALDDEINDVIVPNTGGVWLDLYNQAGIWVSQYVNLYLGLGIPIYSKLEGTQITTTYRMLAGVYFVIGKKQSEINNLMNP